ncbi:hypothetical protein CHARACLAT_000135, partial [Characodon lateralis]|nr:hypothetical protein [Characodon lateralis]
MCTVLVIQEINTSLNRNGDTEDKTKESIHNDKAAAGVHKVEKTCGETTSLHPEDQKPWVESMKSRRRAIRLARVQDYLCKRVHQQPKAFPHDSAYGQKVSQHVSAAHDSASYLYKSQEMQSRESPQVLTYHQIPLLTLDWNSHTSEQQDTVDDILTGRAKMTLSKESEENVPSINDIWESFPKTTHDSNSKGTSVTDVWQVFLNGPSCKHHSDVPESEWLQTAASVLPSNDKELQIQYTKESQKCQKFQEGKDTPTTLQTLAACHLLSDRCETLLAAVALNAKDDQPAEACVSSPKDDNAVAQDASQRSQRNSITDTPQEFNLKRAAPLSEDTSDSPTRCHRDNDWAQENKGIIETAGTGKSQPFALQTPNSVASLKESETTDMTVMAETPNASSVDTISPDARQVGGLYSNREQEVTGTAHNVVDDILAFRETIKEETRDRASYAFSSSMQREEEEITMNYKAKKVPTEEEMFMPQESKECNMPLRYADKIQCEEFRQSENREIDEKEPRTTTRHARFDSKQKSEENLEKNRNILTDVNKDGPPNNHKMEVIKKD